MRPMRFAFRFAPAVRAIRASPSLLAAAALAAACTSEPPPPPPDPGAAAYRAQGCVACHGPAGEGTMMGPSLRGVGDHWTRDDLARYFVEPEAFASSDPRLKQVASKYTMRMRGITAPQDQRLLLADYVKAMR